MYGISVLIVGAPNDLAISSGFLNTFLQPGLTLLPKSASGPNSLSVVGSPCKHFAAFHPLALFLMPKAWSSGTGGLPYPIFLVYPN